jgi:hemerythrin-like metal-binding protein
MDWKETYVLGHVPMDNTHQDFVALVSKLTVADNASMSGCVDQLIEHTLEHFAQENCWMEECGFPPIHCHTGEHERVLQSLRDMQPIIAADPGVGRVVARELEQWFAQHAATMDNALAFYMRQVNYVPLPIAKK